jgi:hypothetical protein
VRTATKSASFHKELLPPASVFYRREFGDALSRPSRGWARTRCVFHEPDRNPSLNVNLENGGFYCFACGSKGGDLIDFVRLRDGLSFRAAAATLGALSEDSEQLRIERVRTKREQERARDAAQALRDEERWLRLELRGEIHLYERIFRDAGEYLGGPDSETGWELLASAQDLLRCAVAGYMVLAFGNQRAREEYIRDFDRRGKIENTVLLQGFVIDDYGHVVEVA